MFCANVPVFFQPPCFAVQSRSYALYLGLASLRLTAKAARQSPGFLSDDSERSFHNEDGQQEQQCTAASRQNHSVDVSLLITTDSPPSSVRCPKSVPSRRIATRRAWDALLTAWWHDYAVRGEVRFLRGRLKFGNSKNTAPFPSAIVVFRATPIEHIPETRHQKRGVSAAQ